MLFGLHLCPTPSQFRLSRHKFQFIAQVARHIDMQIIGFSSADPLQAAVNFAAYWEWNVWICRGVHPINQCHMQLVYRMLSVLLYFSDSNTWPLGSTTAYEYRWRECRFTNIEPRLVLHRLVHDAGGCECCEHRTCC